MRRAVRRSGRERRGRFDHVHVAREERDQSDGVEGGVQERTVDHGDQQGGGRAARAVHHADELLWRQMETAHGRAGQGGGRRTGARGGVRVRRSGRDVEPGAAAPERQPEDQQPEQSAEPLGRVREVGARTAGQKERGADQVHHQD